MTQTVRITVLVDDAASRRGTLSEHGLAFWIDMGTHQALFDTGKGSVLLYNARELGVNLHLTGAIVLSHGHYDHTGGLSLALCAARGTVVYAHPDAFRPRYVRDDDGTAREAYTPGTNETFIRGQGSELVWTREPVDILPGIFVTGEIPRRTRFEHASDRFYLDRELRQPDPLIDDQAVYIETDKGIVVLLGCAHSGAINTLHYVRELTGGRPILAVLGGMHLGHASPDQLDATVVALRQLDIGLLGPAHCTGLAATSRFCREFPDRCVPCAAGTSLEFSLPPGPTTSELISQLLSDANDCPRRDKEGRHEE